MTRKKLLCSEALSLAASNFLGEPNTEKYSWYKVVATVWLSTLGGGCWLNRGFFTSQSPFDDRLSESISGWHLARQELFEGHMLQDRIISLSIHPPNIGDVPQPFIFVFHHLGLHHHVFAQGFLLDQQSWVIWLGSQLVVLWHVPLSLWHFRYHVSRRYDISYLVTPSEVHDGHVVWCKSGNPPSPECIEVLGCHHIC